MEKVIDITARQDFSKLAVEKIAQELKDFKGDRYGDAVKKHVAATLTHFCQQNQKFAEVVYRTKRTLSDCCAEIMQGCGQSISDIDVYRGAVRNYFPNADVVFTMTIAINGEAPTEEELAREIKKPEPKKTPEKKKPDPEKKDTPAKAPKAASEPRKAPAKETPAPKAEKPKEAPQPAAKPSPTDYIQLTLF